MTWVAQELMVWLVLAFVCGVVAGALLSLARVTVDRWVEVPVAPEAAPAVSQAPAEETAAKPRTAAREAEPVFPGLEGEAAPWEQQEGWSRPATPVRTQSSSRSGDEWDDAAANWRTWADEATGRDGAAEDESPLPGGGRRVAGAAAEAAARFESPPAYDEPAGDPFPTSAEPYPAAPAWDAPAARSGGASDHDLFAADRAVDGGLDAWDDEHDDDHDDHVDEVPEPVDVVVPPRSPVSDHELFARDRAEEVFPDPEPAVFPEPVADVFPEPEPVAEVFPEPVADVFPEPAAEVFPEPEPELPAPPRVEHSPFDSASGGFVRRRRSELRTDPEPDSEPEPTPEPVVEPVDVAAVFPEPEPEPVAEVFPEPEPEPVVEPVDVAAVFTDGEPIVEPEPVAEVSSEPEPEAVEEEPFEAGVFPTVDPVEQPAAAAVEPEPLAVEEEPFEPGVFPTYDAPAARLEPEPEPELEPEPEPELVSNDEDDEEEEEPDETFWRHGPAGQGSMYAPIDGTVPPGYPIKGQQSMMLFYPRGAKFYSRVVADVYFATEEAAEHAGFTRWDRRGSAAHVIRPNADD